MILRFKGKVFSLVRKVVSPSFLILLSISFVLWFVMRLSRQYTTQVDIEVILSEDYDANMAVSQESVWVRVLVSGDGRDLIYYKIGLGDRVEVPVSQLKFSKATDGSEYLYSIDAESMERALNAIEKKFLVVAITKPMDYVEISEVQSKRVPIVSQIDINCAPQFTVSRGVKLSYDSLDIRGAELLISGINEIFTVPKVVNNAREQVAGNIALEIPDNVVFKENSVNYIADIVGYTELVFSVDVISEHDEAIFAIPSKVEVMAKISLGESSDKELDMGLIEAYVSNESSLLGDEVMRKVELRKVPRDVISYTISPEFVQVYNLE